MAQAFRPCQVVERGVMEHDWLRRAGSIVKRDVTVLAG